MFYEPVNFNNPRGLGPSGKRAGRIALLGLEVLRFMLAVLAILARAFITAEIDKVVAL